MPIPPNDLAAIEQELISVQLERQQAWDVGGVPLDVADLDSRLLWASEREKFITDVGPIPCGSDDRAALRAMKDRYRGQRAFVIGNGPSLNRTPLHLLQDEYTFGVNRIYMLFDRIAWRPTFYTTVDWRFVPDSTDEVNALTGMQLFFPERFRGMLRDGDDVTWYWNDRHYHPSERGFATDASLGIRGAGSVSGAAIQLAFHLGFDPIHLIGCDVSYSVPDSVVQEGPDKFGNGVGLYLTSTEDDDANHFDKRYFGTGKRWHDPNVKRMIEGFQQCQDGAQRQGRTIYNATVGGNLEVFERVDFRSLFPTDSSVPPPEPSLAGFFAAALATADDALMVDIGAGSGRHFAAFAARGWEVLAFEPDPHERRCLSRACPSDWNVFIDARALDGRSGQVDTYTDDEHAGLFLTPLLPELVSHGRATTVTPIEILDFLDGRSPAVLAVDANGWEHEVLRSWPWATARPDLVLVGIDDTVSPLLGFDRRSVARFLTDLEYQLVVVDASSAAFVPDDGWLDDHSGAAFAFVAAPASMQITTELLAALTRAHALATAPRPAPEPSAPDQTDAGLAYTEALARELAEVRSSTSWKLGSGIVQAAARSKQRVHATRGRLKRAVAGVRR